MRIIYTGLPNLPEAVSGAIIALRADLQVGAPLANTDAVRRAIRQAIESRPAAVLLAGDYVYHVADHPDPIIQQVVDLLRPLVEAGIPSFGVLGNHDFATESQSVSQRRAALALRLEQVLEGAGIRILRNE